MEWVAAAEEFMGAFGWGARGKHLGVSRMFGDGDKVSLSRNAHVVARRPRGLISGFLVILPTGGGAVYVPAIAAKLPPQRFRMRLSPRVSEAGGAIFSAYLSRGATREEPRRCVLEDVLVWEGRDIWGTQPFRVRWSCIMRDFLENHFLSDTRLAGGTVFEAANYQSVATTLLAGEPDERTVLEFVPDAAGQKRLIWSTMTKSAAAPVALPKYPTSQPATTPAIRISDVTAQPKQCVGSSEQSTKEKAAIAIDFTIKKEAGMGPDVYAVFKGTERLGLALVRTLAISRALRLATMSVGEASVPVHAEFNKIFEKYEILGVAS